MILIIIGVGIIAFVVGIIIGDINSTPTGIVDFRGYELNTTEDRLRELDRELKMNLERIWLLEANLRCPRLCYIRNQTCHKCELKKKCCE